MISADESTACVQTGAWAQLEQVLPDELREQLAGLILSRLGSGHGEIRIEIHDHAIRRILDGGYIVPKVTN